MAYRLTGSGADAEDIVQDTFARALERPPPDLERALEPWLVRVATNLGIDSLRRRQRTSHAGVWLPDPVELDRALGTQGTESLDGETRYEQVESLSYAFLLALEALTPMQRAVLVLREVLGYCGRETAELLETSEGNAKVVLHRARAAMTAYDHSRCRPTDELETQTRRTLERFVRGLIEGDVDSLQELLTEDVRTLTDGDNRYTALHEPLIGRARAVQFYLRIVQRRAENAQIELRTVNGMPAVLVRFATTVRRQAPCALLRCELDATGQMREIHIILGPSKLQAVLDGL